MKPIILPSDEQLEAVVLFAMNHGPHWKQALRDAWYSGRDANEPYGNLLRQVRNQAGPEWLDSFHLPRDPKPLRRWEGRTTLARAKAVSAARRAPRR